jgi:uncharacterized protein YidB (DUF937 family)
MGLLDSVIGALGSAGAGGGGNSQAALINAVLSMLQGGGAAQGPGGAGGLGGALSGGGLGGLVEAFARNGLGEQARSWVSTGQNLPVSPDQITQVFGRDTLGSLASQLGLGGGAGNDIAGQLSQILPGLVDQLTPKGQIPQGDVHGLNANDIVGMLGGLLGRR